MLVRVEHDEHGNQTLTPVRTLSESEADQLNGDDTDIQRIHIAISFIRWCNEVQSPQQQLMESIPSSDASSGRNECKFAYNERDLPVAQDQAFRMANRLLGEYFQAGIKDGDSWDQLQKIVTEERENG